MVTSEIIPLAAAEPPIPWPRIAWFGLLVLVLFWPVIAGMVFEWNSDEDMGHGFFVPVVAAYIVWQRRSALAMLPARPQWIGYPIIVWGCLQMMLGQLGVEFFVARTALLITLTGILLALWGWPAVKELLFPLVLLVFMIRIPNIIYNQVTLPLQLLASAAAENVLMLIGIPVYREGNVLELAGQRLSVVEACSGIRSLLSLSFLSLVYGYFFDGRVWMRVFLFLATIPIAITANAARVSITGILYEFNEEWAKGVYHTMEGWVIFMVALMGLVLAHRLASFAVNRLRPKEN